MVAAAMDPRLESTLAAMERAVVHARAYLASLEDAPVASTVTPEVLRERLGGPLPERGCDAGEVVDRLVEATAGGHQGSAGGRFFAWPRRSPARGSWSCSTCRATRASR